MRHWTPLSRTLGPGSDPRPFTSVHTGSGVAATEYKADLRWVDGPNKTRLTDQTKTPDAEVALAAFRALLARDDLAGQPVAARFVVSGRSLYFSKFDAPFGRGRIHPEAPLDARAAPERADELARWSPPAAARPGEGRGNVGARAASEAPKDAEGHISEEAGFFLIEWLGALAREAPVQFRMAVALAAHQSVELARENTPEASARHEALEAARKVFTRAAAAAGL